MLPNSFYEASRTLMPKPDKDVTRKTQTYLSHKHRCENLQQNISKSNTVTRKKTVHHNQVGFIPGLPGWPNMEPGPPMGWKIKTTGSHQQMHKKHKNSKTGHGDSSQSARNRVGLVQFDKKICKVNTAGRRPSPPGRLRRHLPCLRPAVFSSRGTTRPWA